MSENTKLGESTLRMKMMARLPRLNVPNIPNIPQHIIQRRNNKQVCFLLNKIIWSTLTSSAITLIHFQLVSMRLF
jgi:hypothetical protein